MDTNEHEFFSRKSRQTASGSRKLERRKKHKRGHGIFTADLAPSPPLRRPVGLRKERIVDSGRAPALGLAACTYGACGSFVPTQSASWPLLCANPSRGAPPLESYPPAPSGRIV